MNGPEPVVEQIRHASRKLVRELGFMRPTLAGTSLAPSAVHALIEIDLSPPVTAARLAGALNLEKSSVSRMLAKLVIQGQVAEKLSPDDGREKLLKLTPKGRRTVAAIHAFGAARVAQALERIPPEHHARVVSGLSAYSHALELSRSGGDGKVPPASLAIHRGYLPGVVGRITEMHAKYYASLVGFGQFFESKVGTELAEFVSRLDNPDNGLWVALLADQMVGAVAIDMQDAAPRTAHLRWFILDDQVRGMGIGRRLLNEALSHCDARGAASVYLWTFSGLDAARHLYESAGFRLVEQVKARQWGKAVTEQRFVRSRSGLQKQSR